MVAEAQSSGGNRESWCLFGFYVSPTKTLSLNKIKPRRATSALWIRTSPPPSRDLAFGTTHDGTGAPTRNQEVTETI